MNETRWFPREGLVRRVTEKLDQERGQQENVVVCGAAGMGKTTFLRAIKEGRVEGLPRDLQRVVYVPAQEFPTNERVDVTQSFQRLARWIVGEAGGDPATVDVLPWRFRTPIPLLRQAIEEGVLLRTEGRVALLFDNLDGLLANRGAPDLFDLLRQLGESAYEEPFDRLHIVVTTSVPLASLGASYASLNNWPDVPLGPLTETEVGGYLALQGAEPGEQFTEILAESGGHPKLLTLGLEAGARDVGSLARWLRSGEQAETVQRWFEPLRGYLHQRIDHREAALSLTREGRASGRASVPREIARELIRFGVAERLPGVEDRTPEWPLKPIGALVRRWIELVCR